MALKGQTTMIPALSSPSNLQSSVPRPRHQMNREVCDPVRCPTDTPESVDWTSCLDPGFLRPSCNTISEDPRTQAPRRRLRLHHRTRSQNLSAHLSKRNTKRGMTFSLLTCLHVLLYTPLSCKFSAPMTVKKKKQ